MTPNNSARPTPTGAAQRCKADVWPPRSMRPYRCERMAKRDGYCTQHHPDSRKVRQAKSDAKWQAEYNATIAVHERQKADARDAARYRALMDALGHAPRPQYLRNLYSDLLELDYRQTPADALTGLLDASLSRGTSASEGAPQQ